MRRKFFLTAEWLDLIFANYVIDPSVLLPHVPAKTELDFYDGKCFVSLVGFLFSDVSVRGLRIPGHTEFPEVNLRFYVRYKENNEWKRGVVFIKEIVPKRIISLVANTFFNERYSTLPMTYSRKSENKKISVSYSWLKEEQHSVAVVADENKMALLKDSEEEFITQHFWGYTPGKGRTSEYHVTHPAWNIYPVNEYQVKCDFGKLYGQEFDFLSTMQCHSVFLADGSAITVFPKRII